MIPTLRTGAIPPITITDIPPPPPPPTTTPIPAIGPIHHIGTLTAGGDARHLQRAAPFEPPLAQHCPANSENGAEETAGNNDGGSQRLEIGGFHLRKRDVCGDADHDDGREGLF